MLLFIPTLSGGGAERVAVNLVRATPGLDWHVVVWRGGGVFERELPPGVPLRVLGGRRLRYSALALRRAASEIRPDILLSSQWEAGIPALLALSPRVAWIPWEHVTDVSQRPWVLARCTTLAYNLRAHRVVCVSDDLLGRLVGGGVDPRKVARIYNPVVGPWIEEGCRTRPEHPWLSAGAGAEVLVAAGRLVHQKGFDLMLEAMARVVRARPSARLIVLGEGPRRPELTALRASLGLDRFVEFAGFQPNPYAYMAASAAFVMSSRWEGLPTVLIEALACGAPAISVDCPSGPREILQDGRAGILVPPENPDALADAVLRVLEDGALRRRLIEEGRERSREFSVEASAQAFVRLFAEVAGGGRVEDG